MFLKAVQYKNNKFQNVCWEDVSSCQTHKYIIDYYNPSVKITTSILTPFMFCALILYVSDGTNLYLFSKFLPEIWWEEINEEIFFFALSFWCLTWNTTPGFTSNKPGHFLMDYDDFKHRSKALKK